MICIDVVETLKGIAWIIFTLVGIRLMQKKNYRTVTTEETRPRRMRDTLRRQALGLVMLVVVVYEFLL